MTSRQIPISSFILRASHRSSKKKRKNKRVSERERESERGRRGGIKLRKVKSLPRTRATRDIPERFSVCPRGASAQDVSP